MEQVLGERTTKEMAYKQVVSQIYNAHDAKVLSAGATRRWVGDAEKHDYGTICLDVRPNPSWLAPLRYLRARRK